MSQYKRDNSPDCLVYLSFCKLEMLRSMATFIPNENGEHAAALFPAFRREGQKNRKSAGGVSIVLPDNGKRLRLVGNRTFDDGTHTMLRHKLSDFERYHLKRPIVESPGKVSDSLDENTVTVEGTHSG